MKLNSGTRRFIVFCAAVLFAALAPVAVFAQEAEEEDAFGNIMNSGYVQINDVTFTAPAAGAPCTVTAKLALQGVEDYDDLSVKSAKLTYVLNGDRKTAATVDMTGAGETYSATIPGQPAGTKVAFYITAADSLGNTSTEALPVDSADKAAAQMVAGVPDMDNSAEIVADSVDILGTYAGYDKDYIYAGYDLQGDASGGTLDPPYLQIYGIKFSNPDADQTEGLMVGKMWIFLPIAKEEGTRDKFLAALPGQITGVMGTLPKEQIDYVKDTGMFVIFISKLLSGSWNEGLLFDVAPRQIDTGSKKKFAGCVKRSIMGDNPSGFLRMIVFTAANAGLDNFMPVPLNCSHFIQLYMRHHEYEVK